MLTLNSIINQLIQIKEHAAASVFFGGVGTFANILQGIDTSSLWTYLPTALGILIPVVVSGIVVIWKAKVDIEHKRELHYLEILKELQTRGIIGKDMSRQEVMEAIRDFGGELPKN